MAEPNVNPAPRNVSSTNGIQGVDLSNVGKYDENTSLDDISKGYTDVGKQLGGIVKQAAEHVGDIQTKLVGNDFGGVNPYMYNTYYQPGANEIQSSWREKGTQKALDVGMERGQKAAEAAVKAAQDNYSNAVNDYNNAIASFRENVTDPTVATVSTDQLGKDNGVVEIENIEKMPQDKFEALNKYLDAAIESTGVKWDDKSDRWAKAVKSTIAERNISEETYNSWDDKTRQEFWDNPYNGLIFKNVYARSYVRSVMGDSGVAKFDESFNSMYKFVDDQRQYLNGLIDELKIEPVKLFKPDRVGVTAEDFNDRFLSWISGEDFNDNEINWSEAYNTLMKEGGWVDQNIRQENKEEVKKFITDNSEETKEYTKRDGSHPMMLKNGKEFSKQLIEFSYDKLTDESRKSHNIEVNVTLEETTDSDELQKIMGFDVETLKWYKSMKEEHPEVLDTVANQLAQAYGQTNTIEVADGNKYYLVNGEYKKLDEGTVVLFTPPGVVNDDGSITSEEYKTFLDCWKKLNNQAANYSQSERDALQKTMEESWQKYQESIYMLKIAEGYTDTTMNADMYRSVLFRIDPEKYKSFSVYGKNIEDFVAEWKELSDKDGHKAYVQLGQLLNQAYSKLGFFYAQDMNGNIAQYSLDIGNTGEKAVGQVMSNDANPYENMSPDEAMALYNIITTSMQEYQRGNNQDKNINPHFIDDDNAGFGHDFGNAALNAFSAMIDLPAALITLGVGAAGNLFLPDDKKIDPRDLKGFSFRQALASVWPDNWGKDYWGDLNSGITWNELWGDGPKKGTLDYFTQMSNLQQQNLADAINPFMVEHWFGDENSPEIISIGRGYTSRTKGIFDLGAASALDIYGLNTMFANGTAFKESLAKLAGGLVGARFGQMFIVGAYKEAAFLTMSKIKNVSQSMAENIRISMAAREIKNTSDAVIAEGVKKSTLVQTMEQQAAKSNFGGTANLGAGTELKIGDSREFIMKNMSELSLNNSSPVTEGFSTEFLERQFGSKASSGPLKSSMFTGDQAKAFAAVEKELGGNLAKAVAQETLQQTTLSLGTGLPAEAFSNMNAATQRMFMKAYNAALNGTATANTVTLSAKEFLRSLGPEGIKEAATKVAQESAAAAARGMSWQNADTFRVLATLGWDGASTRALLTEIGQDFMFDMVRDTMRNATNAYLTNEGWQRQTVEEYFTNPWTYVQNALFSAVHFTSQRIGAQVKDNVYTHRYNKHLQAYAASGDQPDVQAKELAKINQYINKIQKNTNKLVRSGQPYSQIKTSSEKVNEDLTYIIAKQYEKSGTNPITGESDTRFHNADEFNEYLNKQHMSVTDKINLANRGLVIETQNNFILSRYEMGGSDPTKLANIKDWHVNWTLQDIEQRTLDKYYDEVISMSGTPMDKQRRMYKLYTDAAMEKYGKVIPGLEAALNNYYGRYLADLEADLKANPKTQWTLGYTSLAGMTTLSDDSGDVMFGASFGNNYHTIDRNAADTDKSRSYRDLKRQLLDAFSRGDTELTITRADGKEKTYHLNKDGLNYLKTITAYNNSNTVHKYYDPIFGDSIQTREHKDRVNTAEAAFRSKDTIISGTNIANQAATADEKAAMDIINKYTEIAYERTKGSGDDNIRMKRNQEIADANKAINISQSDKIHKLAQDRAAAEKYLKDIESQKHGLLQHRYKDTLKMIKEIDGELGNIYAQREYAQAVSNTKTAIKAYLNGNLSEDNPVFNYRYGENESIKVTLSDDTMKAISYAARNGQEFNSDLTIAMMTAKRNAVPKRAVDGTNVYSYEDYDRTINDLRQDTKKTGISHSYEIAKLYRDRADKYAKEHNGAKYIPKRATKSEGVSGDGTGVKSTTTYGYKELNGTELNTMTTGFSIEGKEQLVKYASDDYYTLPRTGEKLGQKRTRVIDATTAPYAEMLSQKTGRLTDYDERMISYVVNASEQNLRNIDTGEDGPLHVTIGTLKGEMVKNSPDAELWMDARDYGTTERIVSLSKYGLQPEMMSSELKRIMSAHSKMPDDMKNAFLDTINLYDAISENSGAIKANAFSLDSTIKTGDGEVSRAGAIGDDMVESARSLKANYEKTDLKRAVRVAGDVLRTISDPKSEYASDLVIGAKNQMISASNIAKGVIKDFRELAFDYYNDAVKNPTAENSVYVEAAMSWAKERYKNDPRLKDAEKIVVNDIDCINALGASNHEVMLSAYGNKNGSTYAEYMAAVNNTRNYSAENFDGFYTPEAKDFIRLGANTYGGEVEQAINGITALLNYFPSKNTKTSLLEKQQNYTTQAELISAQYASGSQLAARAADSSSKTLSNYGLGEMKYGELDNAVIIVNRLNKAKAEAEFASAPKADTEVDSRFQLVNALRGKVREAKDAPRYPLLETLAENGNKTAKNMLSRRNYPLLQAFDEADQAGSAKRLQEAWANRGKDDTSISSAILSPEESKANIKTHRDALAKIYKDAGLAKGHRGRIAASEIDAFADKVLNTYKEVTGTTESGLAQNLFALNNAYRDNSENAFISVLAQTYDESARFTYDAQTKLLDDRIKNIDRMISKISNDEIAEPKSSLPLVVEAEYSNSLAKLWDDTVQRWTSHKNIPTLENLKSGLGSNKEILEAQLDAAKSAKKKLELMDNVAQIRDGKSMFFTDKQIMSYEFGREDLSNFVAKTMSRDNYPVGLEIGEGRIEYTVSPMDDGVNIYKGSASSKEKLTQEQPKSPVATAPAEVVVAPGGSRATASYAKEIDGINVLRQKGTENHFGNPFSTKKYAGVQKVVGSIDEAVRNYEAWLRGTDFQDIEPARRQWIVDQINSGKLDGKKLVYYTENVDGGDYFGVNAKRAASQKAEYDALVKKYGENPTSEEGQKEWLRYESGTLNDDGRPGSLVTKYDADTAPNHAHILAKLVNEKAGDTKTDTASVTPNGEVSNAKLKQYLYDKAADIYNRFGQYYEGFELSSKNFEDNGDGTYTIMGKYGYGDKDLHEQTDMDIAAWKNLDTTDIDAERRAILELSTSPIYHSYDEMVDLSKLKEKLADKEKLTSDDFEDQKTIAALSNLENKAYDQYVQLTYALGKEYLDSLEADKQYRKALDKELKSYKIDDVDHETVRRALSSEEYDDYTNAVRVLRRVNEFRNSSDAGVYHSKNGIIFAKDGYNPTGFVDTNVAKAILEGRAVDTESLTDAELTAALSTKENKKDRKQMQKEINKNQNKGSIHYKNSEEYKAIRDSALDKLSARYTLNNYIQFDNQTRDILTGMGLADDEYKILMNKSYSDMMQRVAGKDGGIENEGVKAKFFDLMMHSANLSKSIQDWHLAGGVSNYNAATIAQIRGAILNDPRMAVEYLKVFAVARNSNSVMDYVTQSQEFLCRFVARTGAGEVMTDLNGAISAAPGYEDLGTIQSLISRIRGHHNGDRPVEGRNKVSRAFGMFSDDMDALFSDATFRNTLPLFKLRMIQINYDEALRYLKKFKGFDKLAADDVEDACMWMAYAKTTDFFEPRKTRGSNWDEFTKNIANEELRKNAASWTGAKRDASLMDNASNVFFALRWKMTFGGRVLNGLTNTPGALIRGAKLHGADITDSDTMSMAQQQFMRRGNTTGVGVMILLSSMAMLWNKSLGYDSVSWDDLNPIGEDGEFQVPPILKKFQTIGQFFMPNSRDENGNLRIDPTKKMFNADTFSSIFTISNTAARATDKLLNPNGTTKSPHRGLIWTNSSSDFVNEHIINSPLWRAVGDEIIGANLLSPLKAMYEVIIDDTYFGNNIWEKKKLPDGSDNPNYDPFRNNVASIAHILNFDWMLSGGTNKWVKGYGTSSYQNTGKIGTVGGSGIFQHEFLSAASQILAGNALEGIIEAGELPIKVKNLSASARTDFNTRIKNIITQYVQEYKDSVGPLVSVDAKDEAYAKLVKRCADVVADWSARNKFVLGEDQELVAYVTKTLMAICAGEYNDNLDYVQNAYWKASEIAQIEQGESLFLSDPDLEKWIAEGKTVEEFAQEKNRRSEAYNQAIDDEYQARLALKEAGLPDSYLQAYEDVYGSTAETDFKTQVRAVNKQVFAEIHGVLESPIGEFKNFKEMKAYYESQINAATTTKSKAKLADKYNGILKDTIAPFVNKYGAAILSDGYYNNQNLANSIAEYVIIPADEYYYGKTPRASYLRDQFHVGYRDNSAFPSDKEVYEKYTNALKRVHEGASASAATMLDRLIKDYQNGRLYISPIDYSRIVRMKAELNSRSN